MSAADLTYVVPTYNRPDRLARLLRYLASQNTESPVLVLDSSDAPADGVDLAGAVAAVRGEILRFAPETLPFAKMRDGLARVSTPYAVLWGDDDMLVPSGVEAALSLLEADASLSIAHGVALIAQLRRAGSRTEMVALDPYPQSVVRAENASARLFDHLTDYATTFYSVHRTSDLLHNLTACVENGFGHFWGEYFLSAMSAIQGGFARVDHLYMVRECHEEMDSMNPGTSRVDFFDFLASPEYGAAYARFRDVLASEIARRDGISVAEATEDVKRSWWAHLALGVPKEYLAEYERPTPGAKARIRRAIKQTPLVGALAAKAQAAVLRGKSGGELSLGGLLDPASPYHADFLPVYEAMTAGTRPTG